VTLLGQGVGLGDPQRSLPTLNVLWFCDLLRLRSLGAPEGAGGGQWQREPCRSEVLRQQERSTVRTAWLCWQKGTASLPSVAGTVSWQVLGNWRNICLLSMGRSSFACWFQTQRQHGYQWGGSWDLKAAGVA